MAIIKCKMCGGDIEISADKTFGTCEYCGSTMTLPKTDDDQRLSLFNRGTHLRRNGEFDKAAAIYERLIGENDADAEAHWNLLLCRYGIEYVQDPASGERIPTCHRASFDSILNDVDYQAALQYSDGVARSLYEKEAQRIAALQKDILAISQKETPFDVFICYKESDENGRRTKDSALAQDIYYQLTDAGYKVFFARITLEDKLGQEYEPYIFAALHSAKVMVVVGTKPEYLNAVWVKNEWSRYLALMRTDRSRLLIPCYRDMDPYDMPEELSMLQSQDMGRIGFIQDLIRGVKKIVDAAKPQEAAAETVKETVVVHNETSGNVHALLDRGQMALEDGEWTKADEFFEQVLNQDAKCGAAYLGKFLASKRTQNTQSFLRHYCESIANKAPTEPNSLACEEDQTFIDACVEKYQVPDYYDSAEIYEELEYDRYYCADRSKYFHDAQERIKQTLDNDRNFTRAEKFATEEIKIQCDTLRKETMSFLQQQEEAAERNAAAEKQRITNDYHAFLKKVEPALAAKQKEALAKKQADEKAAEHLRVEQEKRAEEERIAQERLAKKRRSIFKKLGVAIFAGVVILSFALVITKVIMPASRYSKAEQLRDEGNYDAAIAGFAVLGYYKDAPAQLAQTRALKEEAEEEARNARAYANAEELLANEDYDGAIAAFKKLGDYQDAVSRVEDAKVQKQEAENAQAYQKAVSLQKSGDYEKAADAFVALGNYLDALDQVKECRYLMADQLQAQGETSKAAIAFGKLVGYKDAKERSFALWNKIADRPSIATGNRNTVGLRSNGTVIDIGYNKSGQCEVSDLNSVIAVAAGDYYTVCLKEDGSVVAVGLNSHGKCDVSGWSDIIAVAAGADHTIGLKADGTVVATGKNDDGQCNVSGWSNIIAVAAGNYHTVGLKEDGTVVAVGDNKYGQCDVTQWHNIVAVAADGLHTIGLKADGTVVDVGDNYHDMRDVSSWGNIVAISTGSNHAVGLKTDGSVIVTGEDTLGCCNVSGWSGIVAIAAGNYHTVGLKADGTVVATGQNSDGECNASDWTDIKLPITAKQERGYING